MLFGQLLAIACFTGSTLVFQLELRNVFADCSGDDLRIKAHSGNVEAIAMNEFGRICFISSTALRRASGIYIISRNVPDERLEV
jgi:hypothetical protein